MEDLELIIGGFICSGREPFHIAKDIANFINDNFDKKSSGKTKRAELTWIRDWLRLFPSGVKTGGKLVRGDFKACEKKMIAFIKDYPMYSPKIILEVTKEYVEEFAENDYMYMKAATYFIGKKGEGSELAARCEEYLDREEEDSTKAHVEQVQYFL